MKIFIDSADISEIKEAISYGIIDGVTTNPSLIKKAIDKKKKSKKDIDMNSYIKEIIKVSKGKPVSLEVVGTTYEEMIHEGQTLFKKFNKVAKNVYIKIPVNPCVEENCSKSSDGILAIKTLTKQGIPINCTLIFTPEQALLAAKAGAKFVSPFVGRVDDYIREMNKKIIFLKKD
jgi:transaldolase